MTGCQKSKKNAHHSWLPTINFDVLKSVKLQVNSTQTHTQTNNGRHVAEHNIWYMTLYILEKIVIFHRSHGIKDT